MPTFEFTKDNMPSPERLSLLLEQAGRDVNLVDELLALSRRLALFEQKYGMSSAEFYEKYQRGEMGDEMDFVRWAGRYRLYCAMKEEIEKSLEMVLVVREAVAA